MVENDESSEKNYKYEFRLKMCLRNLIAVRMFLNQKQNQIFISDSFLVILGLHHGKISRSKNNKKKNIFFLIVITKIML